MNGVVRKLMGHCRNAVQKGSVHGSKACGQESFLEVHSNIFAQVAPELMAFGGEFGMVLSADHLK